MEVLIKKQLDDIGRRVKALRKALSINKDELAEAINISEGTINNIENGSGFSADSILKVAYFFAMTLSQLVNTHEIIPTRAELKKQITDFRVLNKLDIPKCLNKTPEIGIELRQLLDNSDFFNTARTIKEIIARFAEDEIMFNGPSISNELKKLSEEGKIERIPSGGKNFLYKIAGIVKE